ncbi:MAG: CPBP family intramembrane metalloprotease [Flavobacteriales bacterium]|nr:CPBP family intramembrane metalloprotease [Flavobacteriales bacterium]
MRYIKEQWQNKIKLDPKLGLFLILFFGIARFLLLLNPNQTTSYGLVLLLFLAMIIAPIVLLTDKGKVAIGYNRPKNHFKVFTSFLYGIVASSIIFFLGHLIYKDSMSNWFVYIAHTYESNLAGMTPENKFNLFITYALIGMTFSPIGEELLYRGIIHRCFSYRYDNNQASIITNVAYAITYLAQFGIVFIDNQWQFLFLPALLWVFLMYLTGRLFYTFREKTGSIFGAIFGHAGFNFAMLFYIFYVIL